MLEINSLSVNYGDHRVLHRVSLTVDAGEVLAVIGPNGAGKSTLVRAVSGVQSIAAGKVLVSGVDLRQLSPGQRARLLAVVPQAIHLPGAYSVYETILLGRTAYMNWLGRAGKLDHDRVQAALQQTHMADLADRRVGELSGGEQQRVLLARALAQDAPLLLLDEPTTHLDLEYQSGLLNLIRKLVQEKRLAVLMVLHDLNLAGLYSDRVALLVDGQIQAIGKPSDVITTHNLSRVYHVPVNVISHPDYGTPLVLPDGRVDTAVQGLNKVSSLGKGANSKEN